MKKILKTALALQDEKTLAPTLGSAGFLLLSSGDDWQIVPLEKNNIPRFLKDLKVDVLICDGIGNCMKDLLELLKIRVIPGIRGEPLRILTCYREGTLPPGTEDWSCTARGKSCGECSGTF